MTKSALGFTLIELLVVIAIIGTLVAVLLPQLNNFNREQVLKNATSDLKSNIRKTQNNASSGLNCNTSGLATSKWIINFGQNTSFYVVNAICSDNSVVSTPYQLPSGIIISGINIDSQSYISASISFNNISSAINFTPSGTISMKITLQDTNINTTKDVVIEKGGNVY